jgi:hypothetical protein
VADSPTWAYIINDIDMEFGRKGRHFQMGLSLNPFLIQRRTCNTWPVMVLL